VDRDVAAALEYAARQNDHPVLRVAWATAQFLVSY